jgi:hypothetical protein
VAKPLVTIVEVDTTQMVMILHAMLAQQELTAQETLTVAQLVPLDISVAQLHHLVQYVVQVHMKMGQGLHALLVQLVNISLVQVKPAVLHEEQELMHIQIIFLALLVQQELLVQEELTVVLTAQQAKPVAVVQTVVSVAQPVLSVVQQEQHVQHVQADGTQTLELRKFFNYIFLGLFKSSLNNLKSRVCLQCPPGYYCPDASKQPIRCRGGYYSAAGATSCTSCTDGNTCPDGHGTTLSCGAGYYSSANSA